MQDYRFSGHAMVDYSDFILAFRSSWIRRLTQSKSIWVNLLETSFNITVKNLWLRGTSFLSRLSNLMHNCFWKEVFCSWQKIIDITALNNENIHSEHIWHNPQIRIDSNSTFPKSYFNADFTSIINLFDSEGNTISLESVNNLNVNTNFLEYAGIKKVVLDRNRLKIQFHKLTKIAKICIEY